MWLFPYPVQYVKYVLNRRLDQLESNNTRFHYILMQNQPNTWYICVQYMSRLFVVTKYLRWLARTEVRSLWSQYDKIEI